MSQIEQTLSERGGRYGTFMDNAAVSQALKGVMRAAPKWDALAPDQKEALDMFASKISRALTGDTSYRDNWHDLVGFAKLVDDRMLTEEQSKVVAPKKR